MPAYGMPGVAVDAKRAKLVGVVAAGVVAVALLAWYLVPAGGDDDRMAVTVLTEHVGDGVQSGTAVRFDGVNVGTVDAVESASPGRQRIQLVLRRSQLFGLTDALAIDYAPGNLFGITEIALRPGTGGTALTDASIVDLTGANAGRATDATLSTLLQSLGQFTGDVLTPQLAQLLAKVATGTRAFAPLLQAVLVTAQTFADTQKVPVPLMFRQFGSTLSGLPHTVDGAIFFLHGLTTNQYMQSEANHKRFDDTFKALIDDVLPSLINVLTTSGQYLPGLVEQLPPLLDASARAVGPPQATSADLRRLIDNLGGAFHESPNGPVLHLNVDLRGVPALAVPLFGHLGGGGR